MPASLDAEQLLRRFDLINERFRGIEDQIVILSEQAEVDYERPVDEVSADVVKLAQAGQTMDAIKPQRELTGADFETARDLVMGI